MADQKFQKSVANECPRQAPTPSAVPSARTEIQREFVRARSGIEKDLAGSQPPSLEKFVAQQKLFDTRLKPLLASIQNPEERAALELHVSRLALSLCGEAAKLVAEKQPKLAAQILRRSLDAGEKVLSAAERHISVAPTLSKRATLTAVRAYSESLVIIAKLEGYDIAEAKAASARQHGSEFAGIGDVLAAAGGAVQALVKSNDRFIERAGRIVPRETAGLENLRLGANVQIYEAANDRCAAERAVITRLSKQIRMPELEAEMTRRGGERRLDTSTGRLSTSINPFGGRPVEVIPEADLGKLAARITADSQRKPIINTLMQGAALSLADGDTRHVHRYVQLMTKIGERDSTARVLGAVLSAKLHAALGGDEQALRESERAVQTALKEVKVLPPSAETTGLVSLAAQTRLEILAGRVVEDKGKPAAAQCYVPQMERLLSQTRHIVPLELQAAHRLNYAKALLESKRFDDSAAELRALFADTRLAKTETIGRARQFQKDHTFSPDAAKLREYFDAIQGQDWRLQVAVIGGSTLIGGLIANAPGAAVGGALGTAFMYGRGIVIGADTAEAAYRAGMSSVNSVETGVNLAATGVDVVTAPFGALKEIVFGIKLAAVPVKLAAIKGGLKLGMLALPGVVAQAGIERMSQGKSALMGITDRLFASGVTEDGLEYLSKMESALAYGAQGMELLSDGALSKVRLYRPVRQMLERDMQFLEHRLGAIAALSGEDILPRLEELRSVVTRIEEIGTSPRKFLEEHPNLPPVLGRPFKEKRLAFEFNKALGAKYPFTNVLEKAGMRHLDYLHLLDLGGRLHYELDEFRRFYGRRSLMPGPRENVERFEHELMARITDVEKLLKGEFPKNGKTAERVHTVYSAGIGRENESSAYRSGLGYPARADLDKKGMDLRMWRETREEFLRLTEALPYHSDAINRALELEHLQLKSSCDGIAKHLTQNSLYGEKYVGLIVGQIPRTEAGRRKVLQDLAAFGIYIDPEILPGKFASERDEREEFLLLARATSQMLRAAFLESNGAARQDLRKALRTLLPADTRTSDPGARSLFALAEALGASAPVRAAR